MHKISGSAIIAHVLTRLMAIRLVAERLLTQLLRWSSNYVSEAAAALLVTVAFSTLFLAAVFYLARDTRQRTVVLERKTAAIITLVESAYDTCSWGGRMCAEMFRDQTRRDECLDHLRTRAQNFNAANSTLKVLGDKESLTRIAELTTALLTHDLGGSPQQSDKCATAVDQFVDFARRSQRLVQGPPFQEKDTFGTEQHVREAAERAAQEARDQLEIEFAAATAAAERANQARIDAARTAREERAAQEARDNLDRERAVRAAAAHHGADLQKRAAEAERAREAAERAAEEAKLALEQGQKRVADEQSAKEAAVDAARAGLEQLSREQRSKNAAWRANARLRREPSQENAGQEKSGMCWHRSVNTLVPCTDTRAGLKAY